MQQLPPALAALGAYRQFIVVQLSPSAAKPGKTDKWPLDPRTGRRADAHDPSNWLDAATACATATAWGPSYCVGFVFTEADPFWFLDIDACLVSGQWSQLATQLLQLLAGAAVEVSQSLAGLHIFGSGAVPLHRSRDIYDLGLEFYTEKRFVALTGFSAAGDASTQHPAAIEWLVANYFPPGGNTGTSDAAAGEGGPREDWSGPADDDVLIERMLRSSSNAAKFGAKARFSDLFEGNLDALSKHFPDAQRAYNASSADSAMASHLAFWTGCDAERMERIMRRSALVRPKWDDHPQYLRGATWSCITAACAIQNEVLTDKDAEPGPGPALIENVEAPAQTAIAGNTFLDAAGQIEHFKGCVYIINDHAVLVPGGKLLKPERFNAIYGGRTFTMDQGNTKVSKKAFEAFTESQILNAPCADEAAFRPDLPPGVVTEMGGQRVANKYWPVDVPRKVGDAAPFTDHMARVLPVLNDRKILLYYMAACVQHKGVKFQWAPLLQGVEGNGKSLFTRCVAQAIGQRYVHLPRTDEIAEKFNAWLFDNIFIGVEDVYVPEAKHDLLEILKPMITGERLAKRDMGVSQTTSDSCANFMFNCNSKDALRKSRNDRRLAIFYTAQQNKADLARDGMTGDYFAKLYRWLKHEDGYAIVSELLHTLPIPDEYNPATGSQRAPDTSSTEEAIREGIGLVEQEIQEAVEQGAPGFAGGWISTTALDRLLEKLRRQAAVPPKRRGKLLEDMGYTKHPGLLDGRVNNIVMPDGNKPRLYVRKDSPLALITEPNKIAHAYTQAQGLSFGTVK